MSDFLGYISRQHTVWCGICGSWAQVDEHYLAIAKELFKKLGWRRTKKKGWVCPECRKEKSC